MHDQRLPHGVRRLPAQQQVDESFWYRGTADAVWTALGNIGYGFGPLLERTGTFVDFPPAAVAIMSLAMILGRLGLVALLLLVLPAFWRR